MASLFHLINSLLLVTLVLPSSPLRSARPRRDARVTTAPTHSSFPAPVDVVLRDTEEEEDDDDVGHSLGHLPVANQLDQTAPPCSYLTHVLTWSLPASFQSLAFRPRGPPPLA